MAIATKEQERKALEQIKKIIAGLGDNSYVGMAFEGCFEIAEENIENDFGCSMKQRAEKAEKDAEYFRELAEFNKSELTKRDEDVEELNKRILDWSIVQKINAIAKHEKDVAAGEVVDAANKIVEYAEHPETEDFKNAVREHRDADARHTATLDVIEALAALH